MSREAMKLALDALEQIKRLTGARWALENNYAGHLEAITALRQALANEALDKMAENARELGIQMQPAQRKQVGDSRFERWYSEDFDPKGKGTKQQMREAYEAGMNDPSPPAQQQQEPVAWCVINDGEIIDEPTLYRDKAEETLAGQIEGCGSEIAPLYASPPAQRTWVGLTDEELEEILADHIDDPYAVAFTVNHKLKEKNT